MEKLKTCPFCGGEAKAFFCEESGTYDVQCQQCGALPFLGRKRGSGRFKSMDDVIAAWNRRAERTCRMKPTGDGSVVCSACRTEYTSRWLHDGEYVERYCPNCGARVEEEQ